MTDRHPKSEEVVAKSQTPKSKPRRINTSRHD